MTTLGFSKHLSLHSSPTTSQASGSLCLPLHTAAPYPRQDVEGVKAQGMTEGEECVGWMSELVTQGLTLSWGGQNGRIQKTRSSGQRPSWPFHSLNLWGTEHSSG